MKTFYVFLALLGLSASGCKTYRVRTEPIRWPVPTVVNVRAPLDRAKSTVVKKITPQIKAIKERVAESIKVADRIEQQGTEAHSEDSVKLTLDLKDASAKILELESSKLELENDLDTALTELGFVQKKLEEVTARLNESEEQKAKMSQAIIDLTEKLNKTETSLHKMKNFFGFAAGGVSGLLLFLVLPSLIPVWYRIGYAAIASVAGFGAIWFLF